MCRIKYVTLVLSLLIFNQDAEALTEKQMFAAQKMGRNVCQPKYKAAPEDIDKMHKGDWNVDHPAMCYMHCALNIYKLMNKDNTLNYESALKQLNTLPPGYREAAEVCTEKCKDAAVTLDDKCTAAYELAKCMYVCNPEKYFLP